MEEKELKDLYDKLSKENKEVVNIVARGMMIAQENTRKVAMNTNIGTSNL